MGRVTASFIGPLNTFPSFDNQEQLSASFAITSGDNRADLGFSALQPYWKQIKQAIGGRCVVLKPNNISYYHFWRKGLWILLYLSLFIIQQRDLIGKIKNLEYIKQLFIKNRMIKDLKTKRYETTEKYVFSCIFHSQNCSFIRMSCNKLFTAKIGYFFRSCLLC